LRGCSFDEPCAFFVRDLEDGSALDVTAGVEVTDNLNAFDRGGRRRVLPATEGRFEGNALRGRFLEECCAVNRRESGEVSAPIVSSCEDRNGSPKGSSQNSSQNVALLDRGGYLIVFPPTERRFKAESPRDSFVGFSGERREELAGGPDITVIVLRICGDAAERSCLESRADIGLFGVDLLSAMVVERAAGTRGGEQMDKRKLKLIQT